MPLSYIPRPRHFMSQASVSLAPSDTGQERLKPLFLQDRRIPPVSQSLSFAQPSSSYKGLPPMSTALLCPDLPSQLLPAYATPTFPFPLPGMLLKSLSIALFYGSHASQGRGHNFPEIPSRICSLRLWTLCCGLCACLFTMLLTEPTHCPQTPPRHLT